MIECSIISRGASMTGSESKPRKNAVRLAMPQDNMAERVLNRMFVLLQKKYAYSDIGYFARFYLPRSQVPFKEIGDFGIIAEIVHYLFDSGKAFKAVRTEATCKRGKKMSRGIGV